MRIFYVDTDSSGNVITGSAIELWRVTGTAPTYSFSAKLLDFSELGSTGMYYVDVAVEGPFGIKKDGSELAYSAGMGPDATFMVAYSKFGANSILAANSAETPASLTIAEDRLVGRLAGGNIAALTAAQVLGLIGLDTATGLVLSDTGTYYTTDNVEAALQEIGANWTNYVAKSLFNANTIIAATADDTPVALTLAEQTLLGRITGGNIAALTTAQVITMLGLTNINFDVSGESTGLTISHNQLNVNFNMDPVLDANDNPVFGTYYLEYVMKNAATAITWATEADKVTVSQLSNTFQLPKPRSDDALYSGGTAGYIFIYGRVKFINSASETETAYSSDDDSFTPPNDYLEASGGAAVQYSKKITASSTTITITKADIISELGLASDFNFRPQVTVDLWLEGAADIYSHVAKTNYSLETETPVASTLVFKEINLTVTNTETYLVSLTVVPLDASKVT